MSKLERYPAYKDSGVEWLGEIPGHWEVKKLKFIANNKTNKSVESDFKIALENIESQTTKYIETQEIVFSEAGINFKKGDVLFGKLRPYLAKVYLAEQEGLCVSEFLVLESRKIKSIFLKYMLVSYSCIEHINSSTYGTKMPRASWNFIGNSLVPIPPKEEQTKIASFLDEKIAQIDKAISQKEKLIQLLKERRQITINEAVTKGLDKDVEFKDSGVEWIGKIPKHWEVEKLKHALKFTTGGTPSSGVEDYYNGEEPWVTISDMTGRYIEKSHFISKKAIRECNMQIIPKDSLLYSFKLSVGQVAFTTQNTYTNEAIASFYPANNIDLNFWYYVLPVYVIRNANKNIYGAYLLNQDLIKNATIIFPPKEEQTKIASFLDEKTSQIDKAIELQQNYIAKLGEYKASLIDSVVTGKVRVA